MKNVKERITLWENKKPSMFERIKFHLGFTYMYTERNFHYEVARSLPFTYVCSFGRMNRFGYREQWFTRLYYDGTITDDFLFGRDNIRDHIKGFILDEIMFMNKFRKLI